MAAQVHTQIPEAGCAESGTDRAPAGSENTALKLHALEARLGELGSLMVAYSGGVDSAFLAATAHRVLGSRMIAVLADSPSLARNDFEAACAFARAQEIPLHIIATEELSRPEYQRNDAYRCFHCKDELFRVMEALGASLGFDRIAYGMNADDTRDFRPGQRAAEEHAVLAPMAEAGLTKIEIRALAKAAGYCALGSSGRTLPFFTRRVWPHRDSARCSNRWKRPRRACGSWASASCAFAITASWPAWNWPAPSCRAPSRWRCSTRSLPLSSWPASNT